MRLAVVPVLIALLFVVRAQSASESSASRDPSRTIGYGQIRYQGLGPERWARRYRRTQSALIWSRGEIKRLRLELKKQRRIVLRKPQVVEAINLACATYGSCSTLWRKAQCESLLNPNAQNRSGASGLFQFLPGTFRSTPYGRLSIWSPYANALAAGWMHAHGRGGEWVCQ